MWDEWSYPEGVILPIVTLETIRPEDSGAARNATEFLGVDPLDMPRTLYRASEGKRS